MQELIKITQEDGKQLISARELHGFLESKQDFTTWIKNRIEKYEFVENINFTLHKIMEGKNWVHEYILTLDTAKELAMVENNEKGRQARKYFIKVEKKYKNQVVKLPNITELAQMVIQSEAEKEKLRLEILEQKPKVDVYNLFLTHGNSKTKKQLGELVGMSSQMINQELCKLGWQRQKRKNNKISYELYQSAMNKGYMWGEQGFEYEDSKFTYELTILPAGILKFLDVMIEKGMKKPDGKMAIINQLVLDFKQINVLREVV